jgi:hypothetical protein
MDNGEKIQTTGDVTGCIKREADCLSKKKNKQRKGKVVGESNRRSSKSEEVLP